MKTFVPVTLSDLQATAKDDKAGICNYGGSKVYWDDSIGNYKYWFKGEVVDADQVKDILNGH